MSPNQYSQNEVEDLSSASTGAKLCPGEWSARDFSNFYVRYRPHLLSHASRLLNNRAQSEEVVQDAFLYLMTSLPELESEVDVLRFLKWKTKMLAIDVLRKEGSISHASLELLDEMIEGSSSVSEQLEAAEDASIVRLALSRLQPRHREILIQSVYLERSIEEIADDMDLTPNAGRQLLFRARKAFKTILVGEAEVDGLTIAEVLALASSKMRTFTLIIGLVVTLGFAGPALLKTVETPTRQIASQEVDDIGKSLPPISTPAPPRPSASGARPASASDSSDVAVIDEPSPAFPASGIERVNPNVKMSTELAGSSETPGPQALNSDSLVEFTRGFLETATSMTAELNQHGESIRLKVGDYELSMLLSTKGGNEPSIDYFLVSGTVEGEELIAISRTTALAVTPGPGGRFLLQFIASDFVLTQLSDRAPASAETYFREIGIQVMLELSSSGDVIRAEPHLILRKSA